MVKYYCFIHLKTFEKLMPIPLSAMFKYPQRMDDLLSSFPAVRADKPAPRAFHLYDNSKTGAKSPRWSTLLLVSCFIRIINKTQTSMGTTQYPVPSTQCPLSIR